MFCFVLCYVYVCRSRGSRRLDRGVGSLVIRCLCVGGGYCEARCKVPLVAWRRCHTSRCVVLFYVLLGCHCLLEATYIAVRFSFGPTCGVWLWQWQVVYVDVDAESRGTTAGGSSNGSAAREVCEAFPGDWGCHTHVADVRGMGAVVYGGPR